MKKKIFSAGFIGILLLLGLVFIGCPTDTSGGNDNPAPAPSPGGNPFMGTWYSSEEEMTLTITASTWALDTEESGTYTRSANIAKFSLDGEDVAEATVSGNTLYFKIYYEDDESETITFTKMTS
jgi:hypothetical protein